MESTTAELPVVRLPHDQCNRSVRAGRSVRELLALWRTDEEGPREPKGRWRFAGYHPDRLAIYLA